MTHQELRSVKQEPATPAVWERPLRIPPIPLPPVDPTRQMTVDEYLKIAKDPARVEQSWKKIPENGNEKRDLMCVILEEILKVTQKSPADLVSRDQYANKRVYTEVAVQVYKRTGRLLSGHAIIKCFRNAKALLRTRLTVLIQKRKLTAEKVEDELLNWPFYGFIRFYRAYTQRLEQTLRQRGTKTSDGDHFVFDVSDDEDETTAELENNDDDDDIIVDTPPVKPTADLRRIKKEPLSRPRSAPYSLEPKQERFYKYQQMQYFNQTVSPQMLKMSPLPQIGKMEYEGPDQLYQDSMLSTTFEDANFKTLQDDLEFFKNFAMRVAEKNPGRIEKMREVLSATMLNFEWSNTDNLGDFFTQLGEKIKENEQGL